MKFPEVQSALRSAYHLIFEAIVYGFSIFHLVRLFLGH
jgi:hypothetical protein